MKIIKTYIDHSKRQPNGVIGKFIQKVFRGQTPDRVAGAAVKWEAKHPWCWCCNDKTVVAAD